MCFGLAMQEFGDVHHGKKRPWHAAVVVETARSKRAFAGEEAAFLAPPTVKNSNAQEAGHYSQNDALSGTTSLVGTVLDQPISHAGNPGQLLFPNATAHELARYQGLRAQQLQFMGNPLISFEDTSNWETSSVARPNKANITLHDDFARSIDSFLSWDPESSEGSGVSHVTHPKMLRNISEEYQRIMKEGTEGRCTIPAVNSRSGVLSMDLDFGRDPAVNVTTWSLREIEQDGVDKAPHRPNFGMLRGKMTREEATMVGSRRSNLVIDKGQGTDTTQSLYDIGEHSEDVSIVIDEMKGPFMDSQIGADSSEDAISGECKDEAEYVSYVHSSGRLSLEEEARLGRRPPTIDCEFEEYFAALLALQ